MTWRNIPNLQIGDQFIFKISNQEGSEFKTLSDNQGTHIGIIGIGSKQSVGRYISFNNAIIQEGIFVNKKLDGFGRVIYANGCYYQGQFKNNKKHGLG